MSIVLLALLIAIPAAVAGFVFLILGALDLYRASRAFSRTVADDLDALAFSLGELSVRAPADAERLATALARANASKQRLEVLTGALRRVQGQWTSLFAIYPKKP